MRFQRAVEAAVPSRHTLVEGGEKRFLKTISKIGVGALVLVMGASLLAMRPHRTNVTEARSLRPT